MTIENERKRFQCYRLRDTIAYEIFFSLPYSVRVCRRKLYERDIWQKRNKGVSRWQNRKSKVNAFYIRIKERAAMSEKSGTKKRNPLKFRDSFPFAAFAMRFSFYNTSADVHS